jgi:class 3 adenylate cyclase/pimeloyl-ACP methyl ester carboxylesterase
MERRLSAILAADMVGYSRLMEADEAGTIARQKAHRRELIDPAFEKFNGRIVKEMGDGLLVEFPSVVDAVQCALHIQRAMPKREADVPEERRIIYRIGINLGDIIVEDNDIFGDGVNVAARLEGLAEPGGICVSDVIHQTVLDRLDEPFRDMGSQRIKNISRAIRVWQWTVDSVPATSLPDIALKQRVRFATSADGTNIAWASIGSGPPVLKAPNWMNHIEYEWNSPLLAPFVKEIASSNQFVRFDQRGNGLSDWDVERIDVEAMIEDMEAVVEAAGLTRFALFGLSQGAGISVHYAARHPEQVSCMILLGGFMRGGLVSGHPEGLKYNEIATMMMRHGWGSTLPTYREFFTSNFIPDASRDVHESWDEMQRISTNAENAIRILEMNSYIDTVDIAKTIKIPTLVLHMAGDRVIPVSAGRKTARLIPGAQFVELPGNDHVVLEGQPCFDMFFEEVRAFLAEHGSQTDTMAGLPD